MANLHQFTEYVKSFCSPSSNLPGSYMRALRYASELLKTCVPRYANLQPIWEIDSLDEIEELYHFVKEEERKGDNSILAVSNIPKSYLQHRYCTNAIKTFGRFLSMSKRDDEALAIYDKAKNAESVALAISRLPVAKPRFYLEDDVNISDRAGREVIREVKQRQNQNVFRQMILRNYGGACCMTGLPVAEALRASHIVGWAEDETTRMLPTNGLCLAATYDAVFDRHLISFDEDFRMILSKSLKEYYQHKVFVETFKRFEGHRLASNVRFPPSQEFMRRHREQMK